MMAGTNFVCKQTSFEPGDMLLAYTDGVTEARNAAGEFFTEDRLLALLPEPVLSVGATLERIEAHVREFVAYAPFADDVTMLAIRRISPHG